MEKEEKGTWFGVSLHGRLAVLTNYRTPAHLIKPDAKSRGERERAHCVCEVMFTCPILSGLIVSDFLSGEVEAGSYCREILQQGHLYNGFSTLVADLK